MTDLETLARSVSAKIREHCDRRIEELKALIVQPKDGKDGARGEKGDAGERGADGADGQRGEKGEAGERGADGADGLRGEKGEAGERGADGADGLRGEKGDAGERGEAGVGVKGDKGDPGEPGLRGADGEAGLRGEKGDAGERGTDHDPEAMRAAVQIEVARHLADVHERVLRLIPVPKDGKDGEAGKSVTLTDIAPLLEGEVSKWELDFERRAGELLQRALAKMREPRDGRDGIGLEDFDLQARDGGRVIALRLRAADGSSVVRELRTALMLDRGSYARGKAYEAGDSVTYGGSIWIAQIDTSASPGDSKDGTPWRLAVKRGKDAA